MAKKLELEKYKLVDEKENVFHLQHPDGTTFQVAKAPLDDETINHIRTFAQPVMMSDGGEVPDPTAGLTPSEPVSDPVSAAALAAQAGVSGIPSSNPNQALEPSHDPYTDALSRLLTPIDSSYSEMGSGYTPPSSVTPNNENTPSPESSDGKTPIAPPAPAAPGSSSVLDEIKKGQDLQDAGILGAANAQSRAADSQAAAWRAYKLKADTINDDYQTKYKKYTAQQDQLIQDIKDTKIDPTRFWANQSTGNRVLAAVSMALSGIGSGLTGAPNAAMAVINKAIDNDIESQKANLGNKNTLLGRLYEQTHNLDEATNMARNTLLASTEGQVHQAAASGQGGTASAAALQLMGTLKQQRAVTNNQMALRQAILNGGMGGDADPASAVTTMVPEAQQKDVFAEIDKAKNANQSRQEMLNQFDQATNENTVAKTGFGLLRTPASILRLQNLGLPLIRDQDGRVNEFEQKAYNNLLPAPGDTQSKIDEKRAGLIDFINSKSAASTAKGFGIDLSRYNMTSGKSTGSQYKPGQVIEKGGYKYKVGSDGKGHLIS